MMKFDWLHQTWRKFAAEHEAHTGLFTCERKMEISRWTEEVSAIRWIPVNLNGLKNVNHNAQGHTPPRDSQAQAHQPTQSPCYTHLRSCAVMDETENTSSYPYMGWLELFLLHIKRS